MRSRCLAMVLLVSILASVLIVPIETNAYRLNNYKLDNPDDVRFTVSTIASQYYELFANGLDAWEDKCSPISVSNTPGNNIYFYSETSVDNGTYAVCRHYNNNSHRIAVYAAFLELSTAERNETVVHEIGHALGLAHCETSKNNISVMRATEFNGKAYPLSDDIQGINALYG